MLYAFGFSRIAVVASDLYFVDPSPRPGQEGAEHGVRLEVRMLERPPIEGSIYAAQPIAIDRPLWRFDLLETVAGPVGSHDRTHHHPNFRAWEPGRRQFVEELSADPLRWLTAKLSDLDALLVEAGHDPADVDPADAADLRDAAPEIVDAVGRLLARVRAGELAPAPAAGELAGARVGWL